MTWLRNFLKRLWFRDEWWGHERRLRDYLGWCHWHSYPVDDRTWSEYLAGKAHPTGPEVTQQNTPTITQHHAR